MNLKDQFVITVSREVGSGGHTVGKILSEKLGVAYCDKDLIEALQKKFELTAGEIERLKKGKKNWFSDFIRYISPVPSPEILGVDACYSSGVTTDDVFKAETEILKGVAAEKSCVIAGRTGFFIFKDHPNRLNVLIIASKPNRIARVMRRQGLAEEDAAALIDELDTARENYIKRYTESSRYDSRNYDLVLNSDGHTEAELADIIISYIK